MDIDLSGRTALVTGGGRGIGKAIALSLAEAGADVAVNSRSDADAAEATVGEIQALGRKAKAYAAAVEDWEQDQAMVAQVLADFGGVGILVNNAGIASRGQSVADTDPAEMERVVRVHAFGPHYLSKLLIPQMRGLGRVPGPDQHLRRTGFKQGADERLTDAAIAAGDQGGCAFNLHGARSLPIGCGGTFRLPSA